MADKVLEPGHRVYVYHDPRPASGKWITDPTIHSTDPDFVLRLQPAAEPPPQPEPEPPPLTQTFAAMPGWDAMGPAQFADMRARGVTAVVVELNWATAEPSEGVFSASYFSAKLNEISTRRSQGFSVILNYGLHHAPAWLLSKPNARFIDQNAEVYVGSDEPDLITHSGLRTYAARYTSQVISRLGGDFTAVRVGGGHWGELQYPPARPNHYWAYNAAAARPDPAWKPGQPSPNGEAARFLGWYLDALSGFQNWQIAALRTAGYVRPIGVLYASDGMRPAGTGPGSAFAQAVATNLNGSSAPERNAEVQHGFDHARHIQAITDGSTAAWCTYAESTGNEPDTQTWIARLGKDKGLPPHMAENSGNDTVAQHENAVRQFRAEGGSVYVWVRGDTLYGAPYEMATYQRLIEE